MEVLPDIKKKCTSSGTGTGAIIFLGAIRVGKKRNRSRYKVTSTLLVLMCI